MGVGRADEAENGMYKCPEGHIYAIDAMGKKSTAEIKEAKARHYEVTQHEYDLQQEYGQAFEKATYRPHDKENYTRPNPLQQQGMTTFLGRY